MSAPTRAPAVVAVQSVFIPYEDESTGVRESAGILINNPVEFNADPTGEEVNQPFAGTRGDTFTTQKGFDGSLSVAGVTPAQEAALYGHAVATSGSSPNEIITVTALTTDVALLGDLQMRVLTNGLADVIYTIFGVRFQNNPGMSGGQNSFDVPEYRFVAQGHPTNGKLYTKKIRETAAAITDAGVA